MKGLLIVLFFAVLSDSYAQPVKDQLEKKIKELESDVQLRHAIVGLLVVESKTGTIVYEHHSQIGLAPASTQKLFTSVAAFELLGKDYRYETSFAHDGKITKNVLEGNFFIKGNGDPTFGSWRWNTTKASFILNKIAEQLKMKGIEKIEGSIYFDESKFLMQPIPDGWIWEDIGNYYGAGSFGINWRENQYDLILASGAKPGDSVKIVKTDPDMDLEGFINNIKTGEKGSGDNANIYLPPFAGASGTIPAGEKNFSISCAMVYPSIQFNKELVLQLRKAGIEISGFPKTRSQQAVKNEQWPIADHHLFSFFSPALDSINYWFLRKSINLYGEALVKTIALKKEGNGDTEKGITIIKDFWAARGIEKSAIHIIDGSGLSPQNRVTADAEVKVLQYARDQSWFGSFYQALPEYNGMRMKSGSIGGARAFAGYHVSKNGKEYTFSIIVNNYDGSSGVVVKKLYAVLDVLK